MTHCWHLNGPVAVPAPLGQGNASYVPLGIFIPPGVYLFSGERYDCTQPGLYRFWHPIQHPDGSAAQTINRIVISGENDGAALASAAAWLTSFGKGDGGKTVSSLTAKARHSRLHMGCGHTSAWLIGMAQSIGVQARSAHILTAETPNGYSDGHQITEIKVNGEWQAFDASLGYRFRGPAGEALNLVDAVLGLRTGSAEFERIAPFKYSSEASNIDGVLQGWDPGSWIDVNNLNDDAQLEQAARRYYQMPFLLSGNVISGFLPAGCEDRAAWVASLGYTVTSEAAFRATFYP